MGSGSLPRPPRVVRGRAPHGTVGSQQERVPPVTCLGRLCSEEGSELGRVLGRCCLETNALCGEGWQCDLGTIAQGDTDTQGDTLLHLRWADGISGWLCVSRALLAP